MASTSATPQRCKQAIFAPPYAACDPDLSYWEWFTTGGYHSPWVCDPKRKEYFACMAAGLPSPGSVTPAPPIISTDPAVYNDPGQVQQVDEGTAERLRNFFENTLPGYFNAGESGETLPGGVPKSWLLYGGLALAAFLVIGGRRR